MNARTSPPSLDTVLPLVTPVLKGVGHEILQLRNNPQLETSSKSSFQDIVTAGDKLSESRLQAFITQTFPTHGIRGEEGAHVESKDGYEWILDPIDGTIEYAGGGELFSISAGILKDGLPQLGFMYFPCSDKLFYAGFGQGAFLNETRLKTQLHERPLSSCIIASNCSSLPAKQSEWDNVVTPLRARSRYLYDVPSLTAMVARLILGQLDCYVHLGATPYDIGAAALIAREAGVTVLSKDFSREEIDFSKPKIPILFSRASKALIDIQEILSAWQKA